MGERKLLLAAAAKAKVTVTPDEIKKAMDDRSTTGAGGEAQFLEALKTNGVSLEFVKKTIGDDRLIQKYFETQVFAGHQGRPTRT